MQLYTLLHSVIVCGAMGESYTYGTNGARSLETNALRGIAGRGYAYHPDHSLRSAGDVHYSFDADGFLTSRTDSGTGEAASFQYSSRGELLRVNLPDGRVVSYRNDPLGGAMCQGVDSLPDAEPEEA